MNRQLLVVHISTLDIQHIKILADCCQIRGTGQVRRLAQFFLSRRLYVPRSTSRYIVTMTSLHAARCRMSAYRHAIGARSSPSCPAPLTTLVVHSRVVQSGPSMHLQVVGAAVIVMVAG